MSKCEIGIEFDRSGREYHGGDKVAGTITIAVREEVKCSRVVLARGWRTHGRGNTEHGEETKEPLSGACVLAPGETVQYPFSFTASREPLTYHGQYLSVDHYVSVRVDVPWALDPKAEEDYIVLPGMPPPDAPFKRDAIRKAEGTLAKPKGIAGKVILGVVALLFLPLLLMLLPFALLFLGIRFVYRSIIRSRLGEVTLKTPHLVVSPEEMWAVELAFTPRRAVTLNGVSVRLTAQERCVSGSGTNKTTHIHKVHDELVWIDEARQLPAGQLHEVRAAVPLPPLRAFSFEASDNHLEWKALVRVDIPRYPDWKKNVELQMVPALFVDAVEPPTGQPVPGTAVRAIAESLLAEPTVAPPHVAEPPVDQEPPPVPVAGPPIAAAPGVKPLGEALDALSAADLFGSKREAAIAERAQDVFRCSVDVQQSLSTIGDHDDARLAGGRTIVGILVGTAHHVQVLTVAAELDQGGALSGEDIWSGTVRIAKWDDLYDRAILHEA